MNWLNENAGVIVLVTAVIVIALTALCLWQLLHLRSRIAVQKLSFLGFWSTSLETGKRYADFTVGNRSIHTVGVQEIGLKNGSVAVNLTAQYREKAGLPSDAKLAIGQRNSITFRLTEEELKKMGAVKEGTRVSVSTLRAYVVDFSGTLYQGRVPAVKKLLKALLKEEREKDSAKDESPAAESEEKTEQIAQD